MTDTPTSTARDQLRSWLATPLGRALLKQEAQLIESAFDGIFGEYCVQLGTWGEPREFLRFARTQRTVLITEDMLEVPDGPPVATGHLHRLPIQSDMMDAAILPHTLEFSSRPHAIIREVHRVLRADGRLIVLGFKPGGLWGLRRLIPGAAMPPGAEELISDRKLCDWLQLLDLHIHGVSRYFFRWPLPASNTKNSGVWESRGRRFWPELGACYMLSAQKRVVPLIPVRKPWRARPKVVGGLVEPTSRVTPIRFDEHH